MPVRMTHPKHGVTLAVGSEVEWNKKYGWVEEPEIKPVADEKSLADQYKEKFGKPPHHRMIDASILSALKE